MPTIRIYNSSEKRSLLSVSRHNDPNPTTRHIPEADMESSKVISYTPPESKSTTIEIYNTHERTNNKEHPKRFLRVLHFRQKAWRHAE